MLLIRGRCPSPRKMPEVAVVMEVGPAIYKAQVIVSDVERKPGRLKSREGEKLRIERDMYFRTQPLSRAKNA